VSRERRPGTVVIAGGGTGGHLIPGLVLATAIRRERPDWRVVLVGARRGLEASLLPARDFSHHLLSVEPLYRRQWWKNARWLHLFFRVVREVRDVLDAERPALVIGTGGYASGPVVWLAARRGIPTAVLELNAFPGLAVRRLARTVREVWLGSPEARAHLRPGRNTAILETGVPIVAPDPELRARTMSGFDLDPERRTLLVTGGSQGAQALNEAIARLLETDLAEAFQIIWLTGKAGFARFRHFHRPPEVRVYDFLDPIAPAYSVADLAITRAGMMTVAEVCAWGIPSIMVPLPSAAADHQTPNARAMAEAGAAIHLPQSELTPDRLAEVISELLASPDRLVAMRRAALARAKPDATQAILTRIGVLSG